MKSTLVLVTGLVSIDIQWNHLTFQLDLDFTESWILEMYEREVRRFETP